MMNFHDWQPTSDVIKTNFFPVDNNHFHELVFALIIKHINGYVTSFIVATINVKMILFLKAIL